MRRISRLVCALFTAACFSLQTASAQTPGGPRRPKPEKPDKSAPGEPYPGEEWAVWYMDTFDRDAPPRVDVRGRGLVEGLAQLWARHLFERVRPDGQQGFSSFDLRWKQGRIEIVGDHEGARRLRGWMFGKKEHSYKGYAAEAEPTLLRKVALAHALLIERRLGTERILAIASAAKDGTDFANQLNALVEK